MPVSSAWLAPVLAALAAIGPFSIDTYLPAFPAIAASLATTDIEVQQTLTAYMTTFAFMVLWHGALADRFGRRRVIFASMVMFAFASLVCAFAPSIEWLWVGRALQGLCGGAGAVVGRAVVRDLYDGAQAQKLMSRVTMIFAAAPAVAPIIGGLLLAVAGWRAIFVFLALFSTALAYLTWRYLPETLPAAARQPLHPLKLGRAYVQVFGSAAFVLLAATVAFNFNGFFLYVLSAPAFVIGHLGLTPQDFGWLFVPAVAGMIAGAALSGRVAGWWHHQRTIAVGFAIMISAALLNLLLSGLTAPGVPWSVLPIGLHTFGMALAMPSLTLMALDRFPARRGLASSCQSFLQVGVNAVTAGTLAPLLWASPLTLAAGTTGFLALGLSSYLHWRRRYGT